MQSLRDIQRRENQVFGIQHKKQLALMIDKLSLMEAQKQIQASLKEDQIQKIKSSRQLGLKQMSHQKGFNQEKFFSDIQEEDSLVKSQRKMLSKTKKNAFVQLIEKKINDLQIEEGVKISMRELEQMFLEVGYELSKIQLNDLYMEMEAGRKFNRAKFLKWVSLNHRFIMKKIPRNRRELSSLFQPNSLKIETNRKVNLSLQTDRANKSRNIIDYKSSSPTIRQIKSSLNLWNQRVLQYDMSIEKRLHKDDLQKEAIEKANQIYQPPVETKKRKKKRPSQVYVNQEQDYQSNNIAFCNFNNTNKVNFYKTGRRTLEQIDENPKLNGDIKNKTVLKSFYRTNDGFRRGLEDEKELKPREEDQLDSKGNDLMKNQNTSTQNQNKAGNRGNLYDTLNTTFFTQTDSVLDDDTNDLKRKSKLFKLNLLENAKQNFRQSKIVVGGTDLQPNESHLREMLLSKLQEGKVGHQKKEFLRNEIKNAFDVIDRNKRARSLAGKALNTLDKDKRERSVDIAREYQEEVRQRLRQNQLQQEKQQESHVEYIASMLPSALEMHQFRKFMKKDKVFESTNGYKIVSNIRTRKDQERLEYLLNNKLSDK